MRLLLFLGLLPILTLQTEAQSQETPDEKRAARRLIQPDKASKLERLETQAVGEFKAVNAFADRFYEEWKKTLNLAELENEFLSRVADNRNSWIDWRDAFEAPESFRIPTEKETRFSLELLSFRALGNVVMDQYDDEIPPELERRFDAIEQARAGLFSGPENPDPEVFLLNVSRFFQEVRDAARPFLKYPARENADPRIRFLDRDPKVGFLVNRGPFLLSIQKEDGDYRITAIEIDDSE